MFDLVIFKTIAVLVLGLIFGSFAGALVARQGVGKRQRSYCDSCGKILAWYDNVPVLSFIYLRGRCRFCRQAIPRWYPMIEVVMAAVFLLTARQTGFLTGLPSWTVIAETIFWLSLAFILVTILFWDWRYYIIPDGLVVAGLILIGWRLLYQAYFYWHNLNSFTILTTNFPSIRESLLGALLISGFFYFLFTWSQGRWIGGGDVKLGFLLGWAVGWRDGLLLLALAYILGAGVAVYLLLSKRAGWKSRMPFGPFLVIAYFLVLWWGNWLWSWLGVSG